MNEDFFFANFLHSLFSCGSHWRHWGGDDVHLYRRGLLNMQMHEILLLVLFSQKAPTLISKPSSVVINTAVSISLLEIMNEATRTVYTPLGIHLDSTIRRNFFHILRVGAMGCKFEPPPRRFPDVSQFLKQISPNGTI